VLLVLPTVLTPAPAFVSAGRYVLFLYAGSGMQYVCDHDGAIVDDLAGDADENAEGPAKPDIPATLANVIVRAPRSCSLGVH
jgi:hypothetical protein